MNTETISTSLSSGNAHMEIVQATEQELIINEVEKLQLKKNELTEKLEKGLLTDLEFTELQEINQKIFNIKKVEGEENRTVKEFFKKKTLSDLFNNQEIRALLDASGLTVYNIYTEFKEPKPKKESKHASDKNETVIVFPKNGGKGSRSFEYKIGRILENATGGKITSDTTKPFPELKASMAGYDTVEKIKPLFTDQGKVYFETDQGKEELLEIVSYIASQSKKEPEPEVKTEPATKTKK